jgi:hypothetical protein
MSGRSTGYDDLLSMACVEQLQVALKSAASSPNAGASSASHRPACGAPSVCECSMRTLGTLTTTAPGIVDISRCGNAAHSGSGG